MAEALAGVAALKDVKLVLPSETLKVQTAAGNQMLRLETAAYPVPVKKQRKYNLTRWAVTGRDDIGVNAACQRIYAALKNEGGPMQTGANSAGSGPAISAPISPKAAGSVSAATLPPWKRGSKPHARPPLPPSPARPSATAPSPSKPPPSGPSWTGAGAWPSAMPPSRRISRPLIGGIAHGHFDDIALQADWYTGDCVFEAPGEPKVTDLEWATTRISHDPDGNVRVLGEIATPQGPIRKLLTFHAASPQIDFDLEFDWQNFGRGSLRLAHVTLLGEAFDDNSLSFAAHNGGRTPDRFALKDQIVEHGAPVSFLVSASCGLGMTEGWLELADKRHRIEVLVDRQTAPLIGLINHRRQRRQAVLPGDAVGAGAG